MVIRIALLCLLFLVSACQQDVDLDQQLAEQIQKHELSGKPQSNVSIPDATAPLSQLGKKLFFSTHLSGNGDVACVSCHHPKLGGGDDLSLPVGIDAENPQLLGLGRKADRAKIDQHSPSQDDGPNVPRNSPTTFNAGYYQKALFWDGRVRLSDVSGSYDGDESAAGIVTPDSLFATPDPQASTDLLFAQSRFPVTSSQEMLGFSSFHAHNDDVRQKIEHRLQQNPAWLSAFQQGFNSQENAKTLISFSSISEALAAYQRSQDFVDTPWARYVQGDQQALSVDQKKGALLFFMGKNGQSCAACHSGDFFTDERYYNLAMPQLGHGKDKLKNDYGRKRVTRLSDDRFRFRTPSLLNAEHTAPYGHAGAYQTLREVIEHHVNPVIAVANFDDSLGHLQQFSAESVDYPYVRKNTEYALKQAQKTGDLPALNYSANDVDQLLLFLSALSDPCVKSAECLQPWLAKADDSLGIPAFEVRPIADKGESEFSAESSVSKPHFKEIAAQSGLQHVFDPSRPELPADQSPDDPKVIRKIVSNMHLTMTGGVATGDVNEDGLPDLFLVGGKNGANRLFINQGKGGFVDVTQESGLNLDGTATNGALIADFTGDGLVDLIVGGVVIRQGSNVEGGEEVPASFSLWKNKGNNRFENITAQSGLVFGRNSFSMAAGDYDVDGDLDLVVGHWHRSRTAKSAEVHIWENTGHGQFVAASKKMGLDGAWPDIDWTFTPSFADINNDSWPDLLFVSDFETTQYFVNNQGKGFVNRTSAEVITDENGMGSALGDYDNDGDLDWFVSGVFDLDPKGVEFNAPLWGKSGNRLYQNKGNGDFVDVTDVVGVRDGGWGWASCFADFNNDGHLDIFHVNGYLYDDHPAWLSMAGKFTHQPPRLFINQGDGSYVDQAEAWGLREDEGRAISCTDFDRDGDIDLVIQQLAKPTLYYQNQLAGNAGFLGVRLRAKLPVAGARLKITTDKGTQIREIQLGGNYLSQNAKEAHFGLGGAKQIEQLEIWLSGKTKVHKTLKNVTANQWLTVDL